jgi:hypothetical protein
VQAAAKPTEPYFELETATPFRRKEMLRPELELRESPPLPAFFPEIEQIIIGDVQPLLAERKQHECAHGEIALIGDARELFAEALPKRERELDDVLALPRSRCHRYDSIRRRHWWRLCARDVLSRKRARERSEIRLNGAKIFACHS